MNWLYLLLLTALIIVAGTRLATYGDMLADRTGMGRMWIGSVLIAATTSLPELFAGVSAVTIYDVPDIAMGEILGSCMFNLLILTLLDGLSPGVPLSTRVSPGHALSIGFSDILVGTVGLGLLAGSRFPSIGHVSGSSLVLLAVYLISVRVTFQYEKRRALAQLEHLPISREMSTARVALIYSLNAAVVVAAACFLPGVANAIAMETGLEKSFIGMLLVALVTSLPEVVVAFAAVRMGAIDLAVGNVLGSNLFNIFILIIVDVFYRPGPLVAAVSPANMIAVLGVLVMNGIAIAGLTFQAAEKRLHIAWDTLAIAAVYLACVLATYWSGAIGH